MSCFGLVVYFLCRKVSAGDSVHPTLPPYSLNLVIEMRSSRGDRRFMSFERWTSCFRIFVLQRSRISWSDNVCPRVPHQNHGTLSVNISSSFSKRISQWGARKRICANAFGDNWKRKKKLKHNIQNMNVSAVFPIRTVCRNTCHERLIETRGRPYASRVGVRENNGLRQDYYSVKGTKKTTTKK